MDQSTLDDEDLFGEAAGELHADVESHLEAGWAAMPDPESFWDVEATNVLGVLNTLRSELDVEEASEQLRHAKKWYALGERANAFEDGEDLEARIDELAGTIEELESIRNDVGAVASSLPSLRERLAGDLDEQAEALPAD